MMAKNRLKWTESDETMLWDLSKAGWNHKRISRKLKRTESAVLNRLNVLRQQFSERKSRRNRGGHRKRKLEFQSTQKVKKLKRENPTKEMDEEILVEQLTAQFLMNSSKQIVPKKPPPPPSVYCVCRRPENGRNMIYCDSCCEWFHISCIGMPKVQFERIRKSGATDWYCEQCIRSMNAHGHGVGIGINNQSVVRKETNSMNTQIPRNTEPETSQRSRPWNDGEERLFREALDLYGKNLTAVAQHIGSRDVKEVERRTDRYFAKLANEGQSSSNKANESGIGYTPSGFTHSESTNSRLTKSGFTPSGTTNNVPTNGVLEIFGDTKMDDVNGTISSTNHCDENQCAVPMDVEDIDIVHEPAVQKKAARSLSRNDWKQWNENEVLRWIGDIGFEHYVGSLARLFEEDQFDGEALSIIEMKDWKELYGITSFKDRKRIMNEIKRLD